MATAPSPQANDTPSASSRAWTTHVQSLKPLERRLFDKFKQADLQAYLTAVDASRETQQKTSLVFRAATWLEPLFSALNIYLPIASAVSQLYPNPSTLVLSGISCIMQLSSGIVRFQEMMTQKLSYLARKMSTLTEYDEKLYHTEPAVQDALVLVYIDILSFCRKALTYLVNDKGEVKRGLKTLSLSLVKPLDRAFSDLTTKFNDDLEDLESKALRCDRQRVLDMLRLQSDLAAEHHETATTFASLDRRMTLHMARDVARQKEQKKSRVLRWIPTTDFSTHYATTCMLHLEGTGQWFKDSQEYLSWKYGDSSSTLRVVGKAGCGKTFLAAVAINDLEILTQPRVGVAYVFCKFGEESARNPLNIFCSLLKQLYQQSDDPGTTMPALFDKKADLQPNGPTWDQLTDLVPALLSSFDQVFLVLDGLDECEESEKLAKLIQQTSSDASGTVVKFIVFHRSEHPKLESTLRDSQSLDIIPTMNSDDIEKYISSELSDQHFSATRTPRFLETVKILRDALREKADGMFLFVSLFIKSLGESITANQMLAKIKIIPKGLFSLYDLCMRRICEQEDDAKDTAFRVLLWALNSTRPLSEKEMLEAVAIRADTRNLDYEGDLLPNGRLLTALCADLVLLDGENRFVLVHASFKDYALQNNSTHLAPFRDYEQLQLEANEILAKSCLTYLLLDDIIALRIEDDKEMAMAIRQHPFLLYAGREWGRHAKSANEEKLREHIMRFLNSPNWNLSFQVNLRYAIESTITPKRKVNVLHLLAMYDLVETSKSIKGFEVLLKTADVFGMLPLDIAARSEQRAMCNWILDAIDIKDDQPPLNPECALHITIVLGWIDIVRRMIDKGVNPNALAGTPPDTPLNLAISTGNTEIAKFLIRAGADIDAKSAGNITPLIQSAHESNLPILCELLERGADMNACDEDGVTALHAAAHVGSLVVVKELVRAKADIHATTGPHGECRTAMHLAALKDHAQVAQFLSDQGAAIEPRDNKGDTPLHLAACTGALETAKVLVSLGASIKAKDSKENTPSHYAARYGYLNLLKYLIEAGAELHSRNNLNMTALHEAIEFSHEDVAAFLIDKGADPNGGGYMDAPVLHYAAKRGCMKTLLSLLGYGAVIDAKNVTGRTALHESVYSNELGVVQRLLELHPILVNAQDNLDDTALHIAAREGHSAIVSCLMDHGAESLPNKLAMHPVHLALVCKEDEVFEKLLTSTNVDIPGRCGRTLLHEAAILGDLSKAATLMKHGALIDARDLFGQTPLYLSVLRGKLEVALYLLNQDADRTLLTHSRSTILHAASRVGDIELCTKLLSMADVEFDPLTLDSKGMSPFSEAVRHRNLGLVKFFLSRGYNDTRPAHNGQSSCHWAAANGDSDMFRLLRTNGASPLAESHEKETTLTCAALRGRWESLLMLTTLGIPIDTLTTRGFSALGCAAANRFPLCVRLLIKSGASVDISSPLLGDMTLLGIAAAAGNAQVAFWLLDGKADVCHIDAFGHRPLDYAQRNASVWSEFSLFTTKHQPLPDHVRQNRLRMTIRKHCRSLQESRSVNVKSHSEWRAWLVEVLAFALLQLSCERYQRDVQLLFFECNFLTTESLHTRSICDLCLSKTLEEFWVCTICIYTSICSACHQDMTASTQRRDASLKTKQVVSDLEIEIRRLRKVCQDIFKMDAVFVMKVLLGVPDLWSWVHRNWRRYKAWRSDHDKASQWKALPRPGYTFLRILRDMGKSVDRKKLDDGEDDPLLTEAQYKIFTSKLKDLNHSHPPDQEVAHFTCTHDNFLHISISDYEKVRNDSHDFNSEGYLVPEFFGRVLATCEDPEQPIELQQDGRLPENLLSSDSALDWDVTQQSQSIDVGESRQQHIEPAASLHEPVGESANTPERTLVKRKLRMGDKPGAGPVTFRKDEHDCTTLYDVYFEVSDKHADEILQISLLDVMAPGSGVKILHDLLEEGSVQACE